MLSGLQAAAQWFASSPRRGVESVGGGATADRLAPVPDAVASLPFGPYPTQLGIASPWADPSLLSTIVWSDLLDAPDLPLSRAAAMAVPAIAKGRHVICPQIASRPIRVLAGDALIEKQPPWLSRTDSDVSPWHRMCWTVDDLLFAGWSLWRANRGWGDVLLSADRVDISRWTVDPQSGALLIDRRPVSRKDYIIIPGPHEGVLSYGRQAIRDAQALNAASSKAAKTPSPTLELHQTGGEPLNKADRDDLIALWAGARRGDNGGVGFTSQWLEVKEHKSIAEALLVEGRNAAAVECARILGIAAAMVDATVAKASLTYETQAGRGLEHYGYGLEPYMDAIAARLSLDDVCPRGQRVAFDITQDVTPAVEPTCPELED